MSLTENLTRRNFVKLGISTGAGVFIHHSAMSEPAPIPPSSPLPPAFPLERARIGFVGLGNMGTNHINNLLHIDGADIVAVCDIVEDKVTKIQDQVENSGRPRPVGYSQGTYDFKRMCEEQDLTLVYTATPWEWHVPVCVAAMINGKHAITEVPAAVTVEECWQLVETAEKHGRYCMMMENCCYGRTEMTVLNMVRKGVLGEIIHGECGYLHDIRDIFLQITPGREWFQAHALNRNGSIYTTHGLGPIAQCMNINRGDQFDYLVSMSTNSLGLPAYAREKLPESDPRRSLTFSSGDVNSTLIRTKAGKTISVSYNCNNPRPYSRINLVQGLKGLVEGYPDRVHIEGVSPAHEWEPIDTYWEKFEPILWRELGKEISGYGHGGMDYIEDYRLIHCLKSGIPLDMDVYDAAAWSAIAELSEKSVTNRSALMDIPDFTRGSWQTRLVQPIPDE